MRPQIWLAQCYNCNNVLTPGIPIPIASASFIRPEPAATAIVSRCLHLCCRSRQILQQNYYDSLVSDGKADRVLGVGLWALRRHFRPKPIFWETLLDVRILIITSDQKTACIRLASWFSLSSKSSMKKHCSVDFARVWAGASLTNRRMMSDNDNRWVPSDTSVVLFDVCLKPLHIRFMLIVMSRNRQSTIRRKS